MSERDTMINPERLEPAVTPDTIEDYFDRYGWTFSRVKDEVWQTGFRGQTSSYRITVQITDNWVFFVINPFVVAPDMPDRRPLLYHHLLRLNHEANLAKFGIDSDGDVFLTIELPTQGFTYTHFADALGAIAHYADATYRDVFNLAHSDDTITPYTLELDQDGSPDADSPSDAF
jgi:hypothetical protein